VIYRERRKALGYPAHARARERRWPDGSRASQGHAASHGGHTAPPGRRPRGRRHPPGL